MWKTIGKVALTAVVESFLSGFFDEAGRRFAKKVLPNDEDDEDDEDGETGEDRD